MTQAACHAAPVTKFRGKAACRGQQILRSTGRQADEVHGAERLIGQQTHADHGHKRNHRAVHSDIDQLGSAPNAIEHDDGAGHGRRQNHQFIQPLPEGQGDHQSDRQRQHKRQLPATDDGQSHSEQHQGDALGSPSVARHQHSGRDRDHDGAQESGQPSRVAQKQTVVEIDVGAAESVQGQVHADSGQRVEQPFQPTRVGVVGLVFGVQDLQVVWCQRLAAVNDRLPGLKRLLGFRSRFQVECGPRDDVPGRDVAAAVRERLRPAAADRPHDQRSREAHANTHPHIPAPGALPAFVQSLSRGGHGGDAGSTRSDRSSSGHRSWQVTKRLGTPVQPASQRCLILSNARQPTINSFSSWVPGRTPAQSLGPSGAERCRLWSSAQSRRLRGASNAPRHRSDRSARGAASRSA